MEHESGTQAILAGLKAKAIEVGVASERRDKAFNELTSAEGELLAAVVEAVRPALRAISSRIPTSGGVQAMGDVNRQRDLPTTYWEIPGFCVDDDRPGPQEDQVRDNGGSYTGADIFLLVDGTFVRLQYEGRWSRWQGSTSEWNVRASTLTATEVANITDVDEAIERLSKALDRQLEGGTERRAAKASARAEKVRAIRSLLQ